MCRVVTCPLKIWFLIVHMKRSKVLSLCWQGVNKFGQLIELNNLANAIVWDFVVILMNVWLI
jgi:hypothetical protein